MASNYDELGGFITDKIHEDFLAYGLDITKMLVENISLPPAVEEVLDKRTSMGIIGNLNQYTQFQAATAMEKAAENDGMAGGGMGMGMGFAMANQMGQSTNQSNNQSNHQSGASSRSAPPPLPQSKTFHLAINGESKGPLTVAQIKTYVKDGAITKESLVWSEGMANWESAGSVAEINQLFSSMPPPLPPK